MKLMLKVISSTGDEISNNSFVEETITIGRNNNNTIVLDDPKKFISSQHAIIEYQNTGFFIKDTSTNGVVINNSDQVIGHGNSSKLNDGDKLHIGEYTVVVTEINEVQTLDDPNALVVNETFDFADDPFAELDSDPVQEMIDENQWSTPFGTNENIPATESINKLDLDIFEFDQKESEYKSNIEQPAGIKEAFQPLIVEKKQQDTALTNDIFGEDWFTKGTEDIDEVVTEVPQQESLPQKQKTPVENFEINPGIELEVELPTEIPSQTNESLKAKENTQAVASSTSTLNNQEAELIESFLKGVGLDNTEMGDVLTAESFFIIGKVLRTSVQGTMDVLVGRAKIKNEMHLDVTMIRPKENNPVKFSVSAEEAIRKLLDPQGEGYLSAEDAMEEVFGDILAHQFSVIAGMQTALLEVLKRFNPQKLEQRFQQQNPISSSIPIHKQAKLWNSFELLYKDIEHEATDNFYHLFGQAFAESYEQQIIELKKSRNKSPF